MSIEYLDALRNVIYSAINVAIHECIKEMETTVDNGSTQILIGGERSVAMLAELENYNRQIETIAKTVYHLNCFLELKEREKELLLYSLENL